MKLKLDNWRCILSVTIAIGLATLWTVVSVWGILIYESLREAADDSTYQRLAFDASGSPLIESMSRWQQNPVTYSSPVGKKIEFPNRMDSVELHSYASLYTAFPVTDDAAPESVTRPYLSFHSTTTPGILWYFVHSGTSEGGAWLEGFSAGTRQRVGYLGSKGFTKEFPDGPARFAVDVRFTSAPRQWSAQTSYYSTGVGIPQSTWYGPVSPLDSLVCIPANDNVYLVSIRDHIVRKLFPNGEQVINAGFVDRSDRRSPKKMLAVLTNEALLTFDTERFEQVSRFELRGGLKPWQIVWLTGTDGSTWLAAYDHYRQLSANRFSVTLLHWSASGELLSQQRVELQTLPNAAEGSWAILLGMCLPSSLVVTATTLGIAPAVMATSEGLPLPVAYARVFAAGAIPALALVWLLGIGSAVLTFRHARRQQLSSTESWAWFTFALLFGPTAYLGYRFHRRWPRPLPCPTGGHTLPADRFECPICQTEWPLPAARGIEVLQPAGD